MTQESVPFKPPHRVETGVTVYSRDEIVVSTDDNDPRQVPYDEHFGALAGAAVKELNKNPGTPHDPSFAPTRHLLAQGEDPHQPILKIARSGMFDFGFNFAASVDTSKSSATDRGTEQALEELQTLAHLRSFGLIIVVQTLEAPHITDKEDPRSKRINLLNAGVGQIAVPSMLLLTQPAPEMDTAEMVQQSALASRIDDSNRPQIS